MRSLLWLALGSFAVGTEGFMIAGLLPRIGEDLGVSVARAGILVTVFGVTYAIGAPLIAVATGAIERKRLLLVAIALFGIANLLAAWSDGFFALLAARALLALTAATYTPTATAYAATAVAPHHRGRAISLVYTGFTLALVIGVPLGTAVGTHFGWRATFVGIAGMALVAWIGIALALRRMPALATVGLRQRLETARTPGMPGVLALTVVTLSGAFAIYTYFAAYLHGILGAGPDVVALFLMLFGVTSFFGNLGGGWLADRLPARRSLLVVLALVTLVGAAYAIAGSVPHAVAFAMVVLATAVWGLFGWGFMPIQQARLVSLAPTLAAVSLSLNASAIYIGTAVGSLLGGAALSLGSEKDLGWVVALCAIAGIGILAVTGTPVRTPGEAGEEEGGMLAEPEIVSGEF